MNASGNKFSQESIGRRGRSEELAKSSSFYRKVYSEVGFSFLKLISIFGR